MADHLAIPFFDPRPGYLALRDAIDAAVHRVLASGQYILGSEVEAFEREFAAFVGARHAIGVASGTDALLLALRAVEVGAGDEVITVANAGVPQAAAIRGAGGTPRFIDVTRRELVMDPALLDAACTERTRCLLPVHLYGGAAPIDAIVAQARQRGLAVVEDCAQAHGTRYQGRHVGTFGDVGCFSFYPTKTLGALGDAGACVTDDAGLADRLRRLRVYGFHNGDRHAHTEAGHSRLDEIQAAILRVKLAHLPDALAARRRIVAAYTEALHADGVETPRHQPGVDAAHHLFVVRCRDRPAVVARLQEAGIGFGIHYPLPVHHMEAYRGFAPPSGTLPVSEQAADAVLSLPLFPELAATDQQRVIENINGVPRSF